MLQQVMIRKINRINIQIILLLAICSCEKQISAVQSLKNFIELGQRSDEATELINYIDLKQLYQEWDIIIEDSLNLNKYLNETKAYFFYKPIDKKFRGFEFGNIEYYEFPISDTLTSILLIPKEKELGTLLYFNLRKSTKNWVIVKFGFLVKDAHL